MEHRIRWENKDFDDMGTLSNHGVHALDCKQSLSFPSLQEVRFLEHAIERPAVNGVPCMADFWNKN